jgi:hypothetical protein
MLASIRKRIFISGALLLMLAVLILNMARATAQLGDQSATSTEELPQSPAVVSDTASSNSATIAATQNQTEPALDEATATVVPESQSVTPEGGVAAHLQSEIPAGTVLEAATAQVPAPLSSVPGPAPIGIQRPDLLSWNVFDSRQIGPSTTQTEFRTKWVRFLDADGSFKLIDTALMPTPEGWCMDKAPFKACFPFRSTGTAQFRNTNRFDVVSKASITEPPLDETIKALGVADVAGSIEHGDLGWGNVEYVIYRGAYPDLDADLVFWVHQGTAPTLKKFIRFNNPGLVTSEVRLPFQLSFAEPLTISSRIEGNKTRWDEASPLRTHSRISFVRGATKRGIGIQQPEAWFFNPLFKTEPHKPQRIIQPIDVELTRLRNGVYKQTKIIPQSFFAEAASSAATVVWTDTTTTFYPDPDAETTSVDGLVRQNSTNVDWSALVSGAGSAAISDGVNATSYALSGSTNNKWDEIWRIVHLYDTSAIPDADVVASATVSLYLDTKNDDDFNLSYGLTGSTPSSNTNLVAADFAQVGSVRYASDIDAGDMNGSSYNGNSWTLNGAGIASIDKNGITKFATRVANDIDNSAPSWVSAKSDFITVLTAETAGTSQDPKLVVTHVTPALKVRKPANQSLSNNSSILASDFDLNVGLATSTAYIVDATVLVEASSSVPDLKIRFVAPSGSEVDLGYSVVAGASQGLLPNSQTSSTIALDANTPTVIHVSGTVKVGSAAGPLEFRWAQATADSALLTVRRGSYLRADAL